MREIGAAEAKATFGALLDRVVEGEEVVIVRDGRPVARLVPERSERDREAARAAVARIRARIKARTGPVLSLDELAQFRNEGRR